MMRDRAVMQAPFSDFAIRICFVIRHSYFVIWSSSLYFSISLPRCHSQEN